ncbi:hypothetical protein [Bifidobacterium samirii]|uniref:Uncharacterized protein n=1 Tax=Bifidobacterium samirii TaxID=2306974 RepID=A0A430FUL7_9BIFI|nr:hypothetical protein [Bifidobacterium samirii]RSX56772.1 hypothetical protein D2E24_1062 [Bifidobacterium samirii]
MNANEAARRVMALKPALDGWRVYEHTAHGGAPPWIVLGVDQTGCDVNEAVNVTSRRFTLTARIVGHDAQGVNIVCDRLQDAFDGRHPDGMGALVPYSDSGVYASELTDPETSQQYPMRVLTWRFGE